MVAIVGFASVSAFDGCGIGYCPYMSLLQNWCNKIQNMLLEITLYIGVYRFSFNIRKAACAADFTKPTGVSSICCRYRSTSGLRTIILPDFCGTVWSSSIWGSFTQPMGMRAPHRMDPQMMLSTLLYAWCLGIRSSRRIARACEDQVPFRWLTGNIRPDHCAFARFRSRHEAAINHLFAQVLSLCHEAGSARVGKVYLDGTKMQANGSLAANRTLAHLEEEIGKMHEEMKAADATEDALHGKDRRGDELPPALRGKQERLARLQEAKERLELRRQPSVWSRRRNWPSGRKRSNSAARRNPVANLQVPTEVINHERKATTRFALVTARARSLPACMWGSETAALSNIICTCPASRSAMAGALPL